MRAEAIDARSGGRWWLDGRSSALALLATAMLFASPLSAQTSSYGLTVLREDWSVTSPRPTLTTLRSSPAYFNDVANRAWRPSGATACSQLLGKGVITPISSIKIVGCRLAASGRVDAVTVGEGEGTLAYLARGNRIDLEFATPQGLAHASLIFDLRVPIHISFKRQPAAIATSARPASLENVVTQPPVAAVMVGAVTPFLTDAANHDIAPGLERSLAEFQALASAWRDDLQGWVTERRAYLAFVPRPLPPLPGTAQVSGRASVKLPGALANLVGPGDCSGLKITASIPAGPPVLQDPIARRFGPSPMQPSGAASASARARQVANRFECDYAVRSLPPAIPVSIQVQVVVPGSPPVDLRPVGWTGSTSAPANGRNFAN